MSGTRNDTGRKCARIGTEMTVEPNPEGRNTV